MRIVVHIGTEKTGSTSIQAFCRQNRRALLRRGLLYPARPGPDWHSSLIVASRAPRPRPGAGRGRDIVDEPARAAYAARVQAMLGREIARHRPAQVLLSNEVLAPRLADAASLRRLQALLAPLADEVRILVYLRRQEDFLAGLYSTAVKNGAARTLEEIIAASDLDYDAMLARWAQVFGREALIVRRYGGPGFDILADFAEAVGLGPIAGLARPARMNPSLDGATLELLRRMDPHLGADRARRRRLVRLLERVSEGGPSGLPEAERRAVSAAHAESNRRVKAAYFPGLEGPLFPDPPRGDTAGAGLTLDRAARISARALETALGEAPRGTCARLSGALGRRVADLRDRLARRRRRDGSR